MAYMIESQGGFVSKEEGDNSSEDLVTEPCEVVYEEGELTHAGNDEKEHQPQTSHGSPLNVL